MATPTYELIETTTLTSSASSVTFSSITQDYRDLVLVVNGGCSGGGFLGWRFNSDSGTNYNNLVAQGTGSSTSSFSSTDNIAYVGGGTWGTTLNQIAILQIMDYSATDKHKTVLGRNNRADGGVAMNASRWADTSAITTILLDFTNTSLDFISGSTFSLYGIAS